MEYRDYDCGLWTKCGPNEVVDGLQIGLARQFVAHKNNEIWLAGISFW